MKLDLKRLRDLTEAIARLYRPWLAELRTRSRWTLEPLQARYQKLEPREKVLVQVAGVLCAIFFAYNFIYLPIQDLHADLRDRIETRRRDLEQARRLANSYQRFKLALATAEKRTVPKGQDFSLFTVVEQTFTKAVGRGKIVSITPAAGRLITKQMTQYQVDLQLTNLTLGQLVDALYAVAAMEAPVRVANLHVKRRSGNTHSYDVDLSCVALANNS
jgi:type II secretory pathway component PulM